MIREKYENGFGSKLRALEDTTLACPNILKLIEHPNHVGMLRAGQYTDNCLIKAALHVRARITTNSNQLFPK